MSRRDMQKSDVWNENKLKNEIQFYVSSFILVDKDKEKMWNTIRDTRGKNSHAKAKRIFRTAAAVFFCVMLFGIGINAASNGRVADAIRKFCGMEQERANTLPKYVYTGKDMKMKAICDYLVEHETKEEEYPLIPAPLIYDTIKEDGVWKVFGNFWYFYYYKNGNTLEQKGGGEMPACFHLKEADGAYTVVKVERTGDGEEYVEGIRKFCKGHPAVYEKFFGDVVKDMIKRDKIQKKLLKQYVKDNQLDIKQYHQYGRDPVELFEDAARQNEAANTLPKYVYTGKDMKWKAICDYLVEHETEEMESLILIPIPDIYDTIKEDGVWKVFGNFGCFYYYKNGNTLDKKGGSWMPACFHLKKVNGTYAVVKVEKTAESGPEYMEGIRKFCKGHSSVFEKFFSGDLNEDWERRDKIEKKILKQYVEDNGLDIR